VALRDELAVRDARWSEAVAVGRLAFVEKVKGELGVKALHRELEQIDGTYALRESGEAYSGQFDGCLVPDHMDNSMVLVIRWTPSQSEQSNSADAERISS
jgi:hypothetical protein